MPFFSKFWEIQVRRHFLFSRASHRVAMTCFPALSTSDLVTYIYMFKKFGKHIWYVDGTRLFPLPLWNFRDWKERIFWKGSPVGGDVPNGNSRSIYSAWFYTPRAPAKISGSSGKLNCIVLFEREFPTKFSGFFFINELTNIVSLVSHWLIALSTAILLRSLTDSIGSHKLYYATVTTVCFRFLPSA